MAAGIGKNTAIGIATNLVSFGLGLVLSVVLTRSLEEQRGIYVLLVTTNTLLATVVNLTVGAACTTLLAHGRYTLREVNTAAVLLALGLGALGLGGTVLVFPLLRTNIFQNIPFADLLIALFLIPTTIYQMYWSSMMMGLNRLMRLNQFNLALNIGNTLLMLVLVGVLQWGIPGFLAGWVLTAAAGTVGAVLLLGRTERFAWPPRWRVFRDLLSFGTRLHGASIAHQLFLRFDMYAVNALVGTAGVASYSLATSLAEKLWLPLNAIGASAVGKITQLPRAESALLTARVTRTALLIMVSLAVPLAAISPWLIPFLYTPRFVPAILPLVILLVGIPGLAVMLVVNNYIQGRMERPGLLSIISWIELAVSIPLYLGLILWQGIVGAALASTLTYLLAMACTLYVFVRDSGLPVSQVLVPGPADFREYLRLLRAGARRVLEQVSDVRYQVSGIRRHKP